MNTRWPHESDLVSPVREVAPPAENSAERVLWEVGLVLAIPLAAAALIEWAFRAF